jgi:type VI secretion system secreted protein VgrG
MDIHTGVIVAAVLAAIVSFFIFRAAVHSMQSARKYSFYKAHRQYNAAALRLLILSILMFGFAVWLPFYGTPVVYTYYPPSPTPSLTPTITPTGTITSTPTVTSIPTMTGTPSVTDTPTMTVTPFIPIAVEAQFKGVLTPNPEALFTEIQFSTKFDGINPIDPATSFNLPITTMYGGFDYNNTVPDTQWTALWYRNGELIYYETKPWDGGTGGIGGHTDCSNPVGGWIPGNYEVQIFMGYEWKKVGRFIIIGDTTPTAP